MDRQIGNEYFDFWVVEFVNGGGEEDYCRDIFRTEKGAKDRYDWCLNLGREAVKAGYGTEDDWQVFMYGDIFAEDR